jgi:hypothetical protein
MLLGDVGRQIQRPPAMLRAIDRHQNLADHRTASPGPRIGVPRAAMAGTVNAAPARLNA